VNAHSSAERACVNFVQPALFRVIAAIGDNVASISAVFSEFTAFFASHKTLKGKISCHPPRISVK
jgi:hypothetical protein